MESGKAEAVFPKLLAQNGLVGSDPYHKNLIVQVSSEIPVDSAGWLENQSHTGLVVAGWSM
jgi:hypothetical protein